MYRSQKPAEKKIPVKIKELTVAGAIFEVRHTDHGIVSEDLKKSVTSAVLPDVSGDLKIKLKWRVSNGEKTVYHIKFEPKSMSSDQFDQLHKLSLAYEQKKRSVESGDDADFVLRAEAPGSSEDDFQSISRAFDEDVLPQSETMSVSDSHYDIKEFFIGDEHLVLSHSNEPEVFPLDHNAESSGTDITLYKIEF